MYWYYRGVCEEKLGHSDRAIDAYKRYHELDAGLIKWNKTAASAAMNMTKLLMHKEGDNKEAIYSQLQIIDDNTNINKEDWNLSYFAGLVYLYKFGDIFNAKRELRKAEEKLSRSYYDEWKKFKNKLEDEKEINIPVADPNDKRNICGNSEYIGNLDNTIPSGHNLYLCRLALNNARISESGEKIKENAGLINELNNLINKETTSIFEGLNYFESVGDNAFLKKYIQEIASVRIIKEKNTFSKDELIVVLPFKCFLLTETYPTMHFYNEQYGQCAIKPLYDDRKERFLTLGQKIKLSYRINIEDIKEKNAKHILLRIPFGNNQTINIMFDTDDIFNENFINPFMFARSFVYNDKTYKLPGNVVVTDFDDTFEIDTGWNPIQECKGWRVQSSGNKIRIIDNWDRVRLQFSNTNGKAIAIKDKLWKDICEQLKNADYWENWLKNNPSYCRDVLQRL
jgi:hypothetical protein